MQDKRPNERQTVKIKLLSQWKLEAEFRKNEHRSDDYYLFAPADQPSALVLPLTLSLSFLGCSTEADSQAAGWRAHKRSTDDSNIIDPPSTLANLPASGTWLVVGPSCGTCLQESIIPFPPNQPLIS